MELVYDAEINVKSLAIYLIFKIIDLLSEECKMNRMTNLFIELMSSLNEEVNKKISLLIGEVFMKVKKKYNYQKRNLIHTSAFFHKEEINLNKFHLIVEALY